ncbi:MAG TPA: GNAT family N-acetyltransferase [Phototrophicaceae bacterium]|nr:GNAT family N-acetyltransferase [Phototrophicaceae bacterium]
MKIRLATLNDTASLTFLRQERVVLLQQSDPRLTAPSDDFDTMLNDPNCRVVVGEIDDRIVGYAAGYIRQYLEHPLFPEVGLIAEMTLDAHKYYGGLGRALFLELRNRLNQTTISRMVVRVARYHAVEQAFWRSLGASEDPEPIFEISPALVWMRLT